MIQILEAGSRLEFNHLRRVNIAVETLTANTQNVTFLVHNAAVTPTTILLVWNAVTDSQNHAFSSHVQQLLPQSCLQLQPPHSDHGSNPVLTQS